MLVNKKPTYISLFSSAGVGCYGFKLAGFDCVATNEILKKRLDIQRFNEKCKYDSGYICGDISDDNIQNLLYKEIDFWKAKENLKKVDVIIATPPCQGMSVANHKKNEKEIIRNSLVVESIKIIKKVNPRFFVFENVPAFMKTICTDIDGKQKTISEAIYENLGQNYSYVSRILNFKNYGACSSRLRTLVIGVSKDFSDEVSPYELYPDIMKEKTLREVIGFLKPLNDFGEIDENDIFHSFRIYPEYMRSWITELKEGQSAFNNCEDEKKPHRIINGEYVLNKCKNADKYTRQYWDKVGPCIHTRNDLLASQNTIHPNDDRVFSIREIMLMMTVPKSFKWVEEDFGYLNSLSSDNKKKFLKKEEIKIRQSLGEAVPTVIFQSIADKIVRFYEKKTLNLIEIKKLISENNLFDIDVLINFISKNPMNLSSNTLRKIAEYANTARTDNAAFFTDKSLITEMMKALPDSNKEKITVLEPSVGVGNFIPIILKKFEGKEIYLDVIDIDSKSIELAKIILNTYNLPDNCTIDYINDDFLLHKFNNKYDYIIGNPPFNKIKATDKDLKIYRQSAINKNTTNICSFFLDKANLLGNYVSLILPKFILNTPEFSATREYLSEKAIDCIIDFGEKGFKGVLVETVAVFINNTALPSITNIISITRKINILQKQSYIFDDRLPYWIIYRNSDFDSVCLKLDFNVFNVFRDRQITNSILKKNGDIRVLKSRNISDDGKSIINIAGYDSYMDTDDLKNLSVYEYLNRDDVYLTPNMTYKPRVIKKPLHSAVNGSVAILIPKNKISVSEKQLNYFSSDEYRNFYQIARNYQTRSLNVDICSVFFYGLLRSTEKPEPITEKNMCKSEYDQPMFFGFYE